MHRAGSGHVGLVGKDAGVAQRIPCLIWRERRRGYSGKLEYAFNLLAPEFYI
jgi:hypothetical protein